MMLPSFPDTSLDIPEIARRNRSGREERYSLLVPWHHCRGG